jgi:hypothetical protein
MNAAASKSHVDENAPTARDAWGGMESPQRATHRVEVTSACAYCGESLLPADRYCSRCLRAVVSAPAPAAPRDEVPASEPAARAPRPPAASPARMSASTTYALESPVRCPECESEIRTFRVIRVLRTQTSFTSTLPRKGYVIVCPECERLLSAELSGLI